jgi:hypothetical protein
MLKDGLERLLGSSDAFIVDTDGRKIIVHTDRLADEQLGAVEDMLGRFVPQFIEVVRYNHHIEISPKDINKYANCVNAAALAAVNPNYQNDLTSDGTWAYPCNLTSYWNHFVYNTTVQHAYIYAPNGVDINGLFDNSQIKSARIYAPVLKKSTRMFTYCRKLEKVTGSMPELEEVNFFLSDTLMEEWSITTTKLKKGTEFLYRCQKLKRVLVEFPNLVNAPGFCHLAQLDKASSLRILNSIPAWTDEAEHLITLGIHVDHKTDEEVLAAIANAENKGWSLTVQWNGTPTAQASVTYGLRTPPIYAKVSEMERTDGTTKRYLDWGHYVTDPSGYEEFRSEDAAREYYGLPEEDLTETETE